MAILLQLHIKPQTTERFVKFLSIFASPLTKDKVLPAEAKETISRHNERSETVVLTKQGARYFFLLFFLWEANTFIGSLDGICIGDMDI